jgi:hypothetical protein
LAHNWRTANAALARVFRHLRDCDVALHRRSGGSWPQQTARNNLAATIVATFLSFCSALWRKSDQTTD